ncbi:MAG TPA: ABC transporter permease, partial [Candidatus Limnocylindrales bacterium]|nr:ABC transporter permease [Candidatus Limnocylindrales bacterium]
NPVPGIRDTSNMVTVMRGERSEHPTPPFSYPDYLDLRDRSRSLSGLLAYHDDYVAITGSGRPQRVYAALTSTNYFDVLGVRPHLGRMFLPSEENDRIGAAVVVIGYDLWQSRFASDPNIIGKSVQINLHPYTIIGVAPRHFQGCKTGLRAELWVPLGMDRLVWGWNRPDHRDTFWLNVLGKLRSSVDRRQAEGELNQLMQGIVQQYPTSHQGANQITTDPLWRSPFGANVYLYGTLPILLALATALLLLACANVANLMLVRSVARRRELALRLSMGASRWRLFRQLLVESLLVALAAGLVAMLLTTWTSGTFAAFFPPLNLPLTLNGHVDRIVFLVTMLISIVTAAVSGVLPALRTSGISPVAVLKEEAVSTSGGVRRSQLSSGLVVAQISLSFLLLICAGLFVRSLQNSKRLDAGFDPNHVFLATYELDPLGYSDAMGTEFHRQLLARSRELPGVESATIADFSPLNFTIHSEEALPEGYVPRPHESMEIDRGLVGPNYLHTMRTALISGRDFTDQDTEKSQPVAIINQALVDRYWKGQNAVGRRIAVNGRWFTVVGVAANGKYRRLSYDAAPLVLLPLFQRYTDEVIIHARVAGEPQALGFAVEKTIHQLNPDVPLFNVTTLAVSMQGGNVIERVAVTFAGSFGLLSLILAAVGIYGVVAYTTRQRTREIGIRVAMGAQRGDILRTVLGQGIRLTLAGLAIGLGVSYVLTRFLRSMLFGVGITDGATFGAVALLLCLVALTACYIPARRATRVDPMVALRYE